MYYEVAGCGRVCVEEYGINPSNFANDVSKRFACLTSVEEEYYLSKGRPGLE